MSAVMFFDYVDFDEPRGEMGVSNNAALGSASWKLDFFSERSCRTQRIK